MSPTAGYTVVGLLVEIGDRSTSDIERPLLRSASDESGRLGMATTATTTEPVLQNMTKSGAPHTSRLTPIPLTSARVASAAEADNSMKRGAGFAEPVCVSADEAFRVLGVGRTAGYKAINSGTFPVAIVRIGRIIRVPLIPLRRVLGIEVDESIESELLS